MATRKGLYPSALATIKAKLEAPVQAGADAYADKLKENVSAGPRSGRQYPGLPRQSAAKGQYPQEQFGDLKASVDTAPANNPLIWQAGFHGEPMGKLVWLEYRGGFQPLQRTAEDPDTRREMLEAARKAGR